MREKLRPPFVLFVVCLVTVAAIVLVRNLTFVDNTGVLTEKLQAACVKAMGDGEYEMIPELTYDGIASVIRAKDGSGLCFEAVADGYVKGGIRLVVGIDPEGVLTGVSVVSLLETPGLGTKVADEAFLSLFDGRSEKQSVVKRDAVGDTQVDAVTGATYSSRGVANAVNAALAAFPQAKEALE